MSYQYIIQAEDQHLILEVDLPVDNISVFRLFSEARDALANHYRAERDAYRDRVNEALSLRTSDVVKPVGGDYQGEYHPSY